MLDERNPATLAALLSDFEWVDLSQALKAGILAWPTHARFGHVLYEDTLRATSPATTSS